MITKVFEIDNYFHSIEDQIKPIIKPPMILIPVFKTVKYETIKEDGRSLGYPADYGNFVTIQFEEFAGVLADDCIAFLDMSNLKRKEAKAQAFSFDDFFDWDYDEAVEKPEKFKTIVDTKNEWMIVTDAGQVLYRTVQFDNEYFLKINRDKEEYATDKDVLDEILSAQKSRNNSIRESNQALKSANKIIEKLQETIKV